MNEAREIVPDQRSAPDPEEIGNRIRTMRKQKGLSQEQIAKELRCDRSRISKAERGRIRMPKALIRQIAETYSISYEWLMTGKGVMETGRNDREIELKMIMEALRSDSELRGDVMEMIKKRG